MAATDIIFQNALTVRMDARKFPRSRSSSLFSIRAPNSIFVVAISDVVWDYLKHPSSSVLYHVFFTRAWLRLQR